MEKINVYFLSLAVFVSFQIALAHDSHLCKIGWSEKSGVINWRCSGSLITKTFVLTTGSCTHHNDDLPDVIEMVDGQQIKIKNITRHYRYKTTSSYHNMALIELVSPALKAVPACLWIHDDIDANQRFVVLGQGVTGSFIKSEAMLVSTDKCHEYYNFTQRLRFGILSAQMCSINSRATECPTDYGGPLQSLLSYGQKRVPFVFGLKSIGKSCGTKTPGGYTRNFSYRSWIEVIAGELFNHDVCAQRYPLY